MYTNLPTRQIDEKGRIMLKHHLDDILYGRIEEHDNLRLFGLFSDPTIFQDPDPYNLRSVLEMDQIYVVERANNNNRILLPKDFRDGLESTVYYLLRPQSLTLIGTLK